MCINLISRGDLREGQMVNHDIQVIRVSVEEGRPLSNDEKSNLSSWGLILSRSMGKLSVEDGLVKIKGKAGTKTVVPPDMVMEVLQDMHQGPGGGHFGIQKTREKVYLRFWWPDCSSDIMWFVAGCGVCGRFKDPQRHLRAELVPIVPARPNQIVGIDMMGPLTTTPRGNRYLLVMVDYFTKWVEAVPVTSQAATTVISCVYEYWVSRHGAPERIHSDQGLILNPLSSRPSVAILTFYIFIRRLTIRKVTGRLNESIVR